MNPVVVNLLASVAVGALTALLATYLALKRFRTEKLWEKKVDAYSQLICAVHELIRIRDAQIDAMHSDSEVPEDIRRQLQTDDGNALRQVFRLSDATSFLVSEEMEKATHELRGEIQFSLVSDSRREVLVKNRIALNSYLQKLKSAARKELRQ